MLTPLGETLNVAYLTVSICWNEREGDYWMVWFKLCSNRLYGGIMLYGQST